MRCPRCQHENRSGAKFCEECATLLAGTCSNCSSQLSARATLTEQVQAFTIARPGGA
jgi:hypothetical protein